MRKINRKANNGDNSAQNQKQQNQKSEGWDDEVRERMILNDK
jgi:hypothetical protein